MNVTPMPNLSVASGSYEGSLFVWDVVRKESWLDKYKTDTDESSAALETNLTVGFHCAVGSIKCIAISSSGNILACGGMDEKIRIFNMTDRKSLGELTTHTGAVTSLEFFQDAYLLSGSEDNTICIWRVHDWNCVHVLGGHKAPVNDLSIHPSGKLALSVSRDRTLKLWNLLEGRIAFTRRLQGTEKSAAYTAERVAWDSDGSHYLIAFHREVQVYSTATNLVMASLAHDARVNQALFLEPLSSPPEPGDDADRRKDGQRRVVTISEAGGGSLLVHQLDGVQVGVWGIAEALGGRPKDIFLSKIRSDEPGADSEVVVVVVVISSTGTLLVINGNILLEGDVSENALMSKSSISAEPRLTCVIAWSPTTDKKVKRKRKKNPSLEKSSEVSKAGAGDEEDNVTQQKRPGKVEEPVVKQSASHSSQNPSSNKSKAKKRRKKQK